MIIGESVDVLRSYVYVFVDPRDDTPFYVGRGTGERPVARRDDRHERARAGRIAELRAAGLEPSIHVLRSGLSDADAALIEAAAVDLIRWTCPGSLDAGRSDAARS